MKYLVKAISIKLKSSAPTLFRIDRIITFSVSVQKQKKKDREKLNYIYLTDRGHLFNGIWQYVDFSTNAII